MYNMDLLFNMVSILLSYFYTFGTKKEMAELEAGIFGIF